MYGLASRDSISKRQSRWVREVDESLRDNPVQTAISKRKSSTPSSETSNIISVMTDTKSEPNSGTDELKTKIVRLEQECEALRKNNSDKSELLERIQRLENLIVFNTERLSREITVLKISERKVTDVEASNDEVCKISNCEDKNKQNFVPFIGDENHVGRENRCTFIENHLSLVVELLWLYPGAHIIYPFGRETNLPNFSDKILDFSIVKDERFVGHTHGNFKRNNEGLYVIELTPPFYLHNDPKQLDDLVLPLVFKCEDEISLEC